MIKKYRLSKKIEILQTLSQILTFKVEDDVRKIINEKIISIIKTL